MTIALSGVEPRLEVRPYAELGRLIELSVLEQAYMTYHGSPRDSQAVVLRYHTDYAVTGELPFFAKRVLGLLCPGSS